MRSASAEGAQDAEEGEGWLVTMVRQISPELADLLDQGLAESFEPELLQAVDDYVRSLVGDLDPATIAQQLLAGIEQGGAVLAGVASGDPECCTAFEGWLRVMTDGADAFVRTDGPLAMLSGLLEGALATILGRVGALLDGSGLVDLLGGALDGVTGKVQALIDGVRAINQTVGDQVASFLGIDASEDGLVGLITEQVGALIAETAAGASAVVDSVLQWVFSFPLVDQLHQLVDFALEMRDGVAWLEAHWGEPDLWEQAEALRAELPVFAELLVRGEGVWDQIVGGVVDGSAGALAALDASVTALTGVPLVSGLLGLLQGLVDGFRWVVEAPIWGQISDGVAAGAAYGVGLVRELIDVAAAVGAVILLPPMLLPVVAGAVLRNLPECYLPPIFDLLITVASGALSLALLPVAAAVPPLAVPLQAALEGALDGLRGLDPDEKEAMLVRIGELLSVGVIDELVGGLLEGLLDGVVGQVVGLWDLVGMLNAALNPATWLSMFGERVLAAIEAGAERFDDLGDRAKHEDAHATTPAAPPEAGPPPAATVPEVADLPSLETLLGGLVGDFTGLVSEAMADKAQELARDLLETAESGPYDLAYGLGELQALLLVQGALIVATGGLEALALMGEGAVEALVAVADGGVLGAIESGVAAAWGAVEAVMKDAVAEVARYGEMFEDAVAWLRETWEAVSKWFEDLLEWFRGEPEPIVEDPIPAEPVEPVEGEPPAEEPPAEGEPGEEDPNKKPLHDDTVLGLAAAARAREAFEAIALQDAMVPVALGRTEVAGFDGVVADIVFAASLEVSGETWAVSVTAREEADSATRQSARGWAATDESGVAFLAPDDRTAEDAAFAESAFRKLKSAWEAMDEPSVESIKAEGERIEASFDPPFAGMLFKASFSKFDAAAATIVANLVVTPNALRVSEILEGDKRPDIGTLSRAAAAPARRAGPQRAGLTVAGDMLQKHVMRGDPAFSGLVTSTLSSDINSAAQALVDSLLHDSAAVFTRLGRGGLEVSVPGRPQGARWEGDDSFSSFCSCTP